MRVARREQWRPSRPPRPVYGREIAAILCLKAAGLALLYFLFFAPAHRPAISAQTVARHLFAPASPATAEPGNHREGDP